MAISLHLYICCDFYLLEKMINIIICDNKNRIMIVLTNMKVKCPEWDRIKHTKISYQKVTTRNIHSLFQKYYIIFKGSGSHLLSPNVELDKKIMVCRIKYHVGTLRKKLRTGN